MTKDEISSWLDREGRSREWLALQCGASKRTVDSWFSTRGFPPQAIKIIEKLMDTTTAPPLGIAAQFTLDEFEVIETARSIAGSPSRSIFYHDAILDYAHRIIEQEQKSTETPPDRYQPMRSPSNTPPAPHAKPTANGKGVA